MKLVTFEVRTPVGPFERLGALLGPGVVDLNFACALRFLQQGKAAPQRLADATVPADMLGLLDGGGDSLAAARETLQFVREETSDLVGPRGERILYKEDEIRLLSPLPRPRALRDFFAFEEHAKQGAARRKEPLAPEWYEQPFLQGEPPRSTGRDTIPASYRSSLRVRDRLRRSGRDAIFRLSRPRKPSPATRSQRFLRAISRKRDVSATAPPARTSPPDWDPT